MGDASSLQNALGAAGNQVGNFSKRMTTMGKTAVIAGGIVVAAFTKAFLSFADYEQALIDMAKVTDEPFEKIEAKLKELDPILGSSKELMKGYYQVISAGVTEPVKALDTLTVASKLAKSAHLDQSEAVKGLTKIMAGYEGAIENATEAADLLYAMERYGQVAVAELIPIVGGLAKISSSLGIKQKEMAAAIALGSRTAASAAEAGTQYQSILTGLMKMTPAMTKAIDKMGFATSEAAIKELGFVGVLKKLQEYTGGSSEKLAELFGRKEAMLGFTALGTKGFTEFVEIIEGVEEGVGAADEAFFKWSESSQASITGLQNRFRDFVKDVGEVLEEDINRMLDRISEIIDSIDEWMKTYPELFATIVKGTAAFAAFAVVAGTLAIVIGKIAKPAIFVVGILTSLPVKILALYGLAKLTLENFGIECPKWLSNLYNNFNTWWDKIKENTDAKWVLIVDKIIQALYKISDYTYLILNPIINYLREGMEKNYDTFVYWWNKIAEWMYIPLEKIVSTIRDNWDKIVYVTEFWWSQITFEIQQTWDRIVKIFDTPLAETIGEIWNDIKINTGIIWGDIVAIISGDWDSVSENTQIVLTEIDKTITDTWNSIKTFTEEKWNAIAKYLGDTWETIKINTKTKWGEIKTTINDKVTAISKSITDTISPLVIDISDWWEKIKIDASIKWETIKTTITEKVTGIVDFFTDPMEQLTSDLSDTWDDIKIDTENTWNTIKTSVETIWTGMSDSFKNTWDSIKLKSETIWEAISKTTTDTWDNIKTNTETKWNEISNSLGTTWDGIKTTAEEKWSGITGTITDTIEDLKIWIEETLPKITTFISGTWDNIKANVEEKWAGIVEKIKGFWDRIKGIFTGKKKDEVVTESGKAGEEVEEAFAESLEKSTSPKIKKVIEDWATDMNEAGENITEELSKGIESGSPRIKKAMESVTEEVAKPVRSRSPIQYGELKNLFDWGVNITTELGEGITAGGDALGTIMRVIAEKKVKEPLLSVFGTILPIVKEEVEKIGETVEKAIKPIFFPVTGLEKVLYDLRILEKQYEEIPKDIHYFTEKTKLLNEENVILSGNLEEVTKKSEGESAEVKQATIMLIDNENATRRLNKALEEFNEVQEKELTGLELVRAKMELLELRYTEIEKNAGYYKEKLQLLREEHELLVGSLDEVIKKYGEGSEEHYRLLAAIIACENGMKRWWKEIDEGKETVDEFATAFADKMLKMRVATEGFKPPDINPWKEFFDTLKDKYSDTFGAIQSGISSFMSTAETALGDALYNILSGAESFGDSMKGLFKSIVDAVLKELTRLAAFYVFKWIFASAVPAAAPILAFHQFGGEVKKFQLGGTTDTVMAAVTPGEYVIAKPMTDFIKRFKAFPPNLIEAITGGLPTPVPAFATGGMVGSPNVTTSNFGETKIMIDVHDNRITDDIDMKRLAGTISDEVLRKIEIRRRY